jgi:hybrid cluster-associated redox disulfide protein
MQSDSARITFETTVDEVMRCWPATIRVFLDFRMNCVGCPIAGFHTVQDACREHGAAPTDFLGALREAAEASAADGSAVPRTFGDAEQAVRVPDGDPLPAALDEPLLLPGA